MSARFSVPPGWPVPPPGWTPPDGWQPDPSWSPAPPGWIFWVDDEVNGSGASEPRPAAETSPPADPPPPSPPRPQGFAPTAVPPLPTSTPDALIDSDPEAEVESLRERVADLETQLRKQAASADQSSGVIELEDERVLQEVGIYRYHHPLENAVDFKARLAEIQEGIKQSVKQKRAVLASDLFTFNNSLAKGRKMTSDFSKLMLRAYNSEADSCVRSLRAGNVVTAKRRLEASVTAIAKLGAMMEMRINPEYHQLRLTELELTSDFLMKVQEEKEAAREERERLREERKAEMELAAERERLDKERSHLANAIESLRARGDEAGAAALAARLGQVDDAIAQNDYRAANIRAGYVYVISNAGALGPNMVKIGMTRRLEPMDRVRELGDASVPFPFDVHAMFFSEDAVTLETELHSAFAE
ncbi:MAG: DUF4041 domain-containing protein, partial [Actinobacteria bacterium]|nr:DUF4041 domain-containing protein [Actinomycetota bacterium]